MRLAAFSLIFVAYPALADRQIDPPHPTETEVLSGNVLVWHDAAFYTDASDSAQSVHVAKLDAARKESVGHVVPMHVVSTRGAFVEVEPLGSRDCTWSQLVTQDDLGKLRLFVHRDDLAPVLTKSFSKAFADGTKLTLRAGVAVVPNDDGRYATSLAGDELAAEIPSNSVGFSYTSQRDKVVTVTSQEYSLAPGTKVRLGEQTLTPKNWRAAAITRGDETTVFSIEERCASVQVSVPTKAVRDVAEDEASIGVGGSGHGVLELRNENYLPATTPLSADGRRVAIAAKPIYLPARAIGKTVCIQRRLRLDALIEPNTTDVEDSLRLCAPATRVAHERMRSARSASGSTSR